MNEQPSKQPNAVTIINDADIAALATAARELAPSDIVGLPLRYVKGQWTIRETKDNEIKVGSTDDFVVDVLSYAEGWERWETKKRTHKIIGRRIDGFVAPPRHVLPEADKEEWPIGPKGRTDPWQEVQQIVLKDRANGQLLTWTNSSYGGRRALGDLLKTFAKDSRQHPGLYPVVLLESYDRPTADYGKVPTPRLNVVDWQSFGEGAAPAGDPSQGAARTADTLALAQLAAPTRSRQHDGLDDDIPF